MDLSGKVALITGGGTGLGAAIARRFVADGARVCIAGRTLSRLEQTARELPAGCVEICAGDISKNEDTQRIVQTTLKFGGKVDILVNNAAFDTIGNIIDLDLALWRQVLETNMTGPFMLMKAVLPQMIKAGRGSIISIASLAGIRCVPQEPAYCASKAGLIMLTQQAALDYGPNNIRCNVICPGAFRTQLLEDALSPLKEVLKTDLDGIFTHFTSNTPLRRVADPVEISGLCSYLASDDSSYMTGAVLVIDGGNAIVDASGTTISHAIASQEKLKK
jgi:meso-butanediol dehydrogenase / (S,S)-butanediol dehydrogenase / diacetyl reductase